MFHGDLDRKQLVLHDLPLLENGVITFDEFTHLMDGSTNLSKYTYAQLLQQFQMFDRVSTFLWLAFTIAFIEIFPG